MKGSQHFPEQQDFTSVLSKIELASDEASRALGGLSASVPRPHGAYSARSRTPFRCDGGQHSAVMADTVPR